MRIWLLTCLGLVAVFKPAQAVSHAFLTSCGTQEHKQDFFVDARRCTHGVFLKEPLVPGCVCLAGVWVIQTEICGSKPIIIMGNGTESCFFLNFMIRSLLHLGDPSYLFKTAAFVAPFQLTTFKEIPLGGDWTPYMDIHSPMVVAINPRNYSFEAEVDTNCFRKREMGLEEPVVHLWMSDLPKTRYRTVAKCIDRVGSAYDEMTSLNGFYYHGSNQNNLPLIGCPQADSCYLWDDGRPRPRTDGGQKRTYEDWTVEFKKVKADIQAKEDAEEAEFQRRYKPKSDKRNKRGIVNCEMVWGGKAYCLKSYWDPMDKVHMTERDRKLCFPPQNSTPPVKPPRYG